MEQPGLKPPSPPTLLLCIICNFARTRCAEQLRNSLLWWAGEQLSIVERRAVAESLHGLPDAISRALGARGSNGSAILVNQITQQFLRAPFANLEIDSLEDAAAGFADRDQQRRDRTTFRWIFLPGPCYRT